MVPGLPRRDQAAPVGDQLKSAVCSRNVRSSASKMEATAVTAVALFCYPGGFYPGAMILSGAAGAMRTSRASYPRNVGNISLPRRHGGGRKVADPPHPSSGSPPIIVIGVSASHRDGTRWRGGGSPRASQGLPDAGRPVGGGIGQLKTSVNTLPLPRRSSRRVAVTN